jgi:glutamate/tyrosine decarboxylase-like PLP-dependent enzyme
MNPTAANGNHAATYVEQCVLRWLRDLVGFPATTEGILVDGGSLANFHCLAAALYRACVDDGWDLRNEGLHGMPKRFVVYTSPEVHSCVHKSTRLLGLGAPHQVEMDSRLHMDVRSVAKAVRADRAAGLRPFCVVASAGTVNTGVVDPLGQLARLCAEEGLWLHVDGAYGGFGLLDPSVAPLYAGLERAHSLAMDPHKWLSVPNTCSAVLVSDGAALRGAFGFDASYLRFEADDGFGAGKRFDGLGIYQTRRFLAAKLLGVLLQLGRSGLREHIARHITLRRKLEALVDAEPALERMSDGDLTIVCFRYAPKRLRDDDTRLDEVNKEIVERLQRGGRVFLSGTVVGGRHVLRSCALHYELDEDDLRTIVDEVLSVGAELLTVSG